MNNKKQILVIHGGNTFESREEFLNYLKNTSIDIDKLKIRNDWKKNLQQDLGQEYEILNPKMPNKQNAYYEEWKTWFERIIPLLNENLIIIGHSLGGIFIAKYLSENEFPKNIKSVFLVSAPFDDSYNDKEKLLSFSLSNSLEKLNNQVEQIYLIHSKDDPVVPFEQLDKYKKALPEAKGIVFDNREHFNQEDFPELIKLIKASLV